MIVEVFLVLGLLLALIVKKFTQSKKENLPPGNMEVQRLQAIYNKFTYLYK